MTSDADGRDLPRWGIVLNPQLVTLLTDQVLIAIIVVAVLFIGGTTGLVVARRRKTQLPPPRPLRGWSRLNRR